MTTIDLEAEYNNRARVPDSGELIAGWARDAEAFRAQGHAPTSMSYGAGARNSIDYFAAADDRGPIVVFIHGGYWQALDASFFSHLSRGLTSHGISVAMPSYDLCPQVSVAEIVAQMRAAVRELAMMGRPLVVAGHSAGGHLAACMLATEWPVIDPALRKDTVIAAYAISGLFDLAPLVPTSINKALQLTEESARAVSPLFGPVPGHGSLDAIVGGDESSEYFRQSRSIVDAWGKAISTVYGTVPGANHFTAIAPLADPQSPMVLRLKELATL
ncbi:MAG: alpha/beta hydrolase [Bradyrhizobiaceae bacterium]|nr:MAG: alpha/beta hydrolase [Bradyrhizobiaceae bacterium]